MATSISIRGWWTDPPPSTPDAFGRLIRALPLTFAHLVVRDRRHAAVFRSDGAVDPSQVPAWPDAPGTRAGATGPLACWRFNPEPTRGAVPVTASAWDPAWFAATGTDRAIEGDLALVIEPVGPFCAVADDAADAPRINPGVEENVEGVLDLVKALARAGLDEISVTTDAGEPLPVNQHVVWFRTAEIAAARGSWLLGLCRDGLPAYQIPPLSTPDARATVLHEWRSPAQRRELASALAGATTEPDADRVRAALASGRFDWMEDPGMLVLDYPHPFNAFLDRFWLALVQSA